MRRQRNPEGGEKRKLPSTFTTGHDTSALEGASWWRGATEATRTVIADYDNSPEFSDFRKQVGAVGSSILTILPIPYKKSSDRFTTLWKAL